MDWKLYIILAIIGASLIDSSAIYRRQASTVSPGSTDDSTDDQDADTEMVCEDQEDDEDECLQVPERAMMAAEYFPETISRERALKVLKRAGELIQKPSGTFKKQCRSDLDTDIDAKNLLRFLTGEPTIASAADESSQSSIAQQTDDDFCPEVFVIDNRRPVSDQTLKNIIRLSDQGKSEKAIQSQYKWFRRQYLPRMRRHIEAGGPYSDLYEDIESHVQRKINDSLEAKLPIHDYHLRQWGFDRADEINASGFKASQRWLTGIKKRADLVGRKVTDLSSRPDRAQQAKIEESKVQFAENYRQIGHLFPHHRILNVDQSGHKYEISNLRSLARRGSRDHVLAIDSINKNTHSYTIQPIIGRDGRLRGKLFICFREPADQFGVEVSKKVKALERELGNVVAVASRSGKMSRRLTLQWVDEILIPEMTRLDEADSESLGSQDSQSTELAGPSWASNNPDSWTPEQRRIMQLRNSTVGHRREGVMLVIDSWGGHSSDSLAQELEDRDIFVLRIPPRTTGDLQPLDVQLFRQYKIFVKRVMEAASYEGCLRNMTDRYGIMRMHSVIWNQFQAPVYRDMLLWAWRKTDPDFDPDELENSPPPDMVLNIQFEFDRKHRCDIPNCQSRAFIRCAHCHEHLCLKHFLAGKGVHRQASESADYGNSTSTVRPLERDHDDHDDGSAGAAAFASGAAIGAGATAVGSSAALGTAISVTGSVGFSASGSSSGMEVSHKSKSEEETVPLLDINSGDRIEKIEVFPPAVSYKDLMRDKRNRRYPPRC